VVNKIPKRARSYRQHKRRQAKGWRQREKLEEAERQEAQNLAGPGGEPGPAPEVNPQTLTERFSNDYT
jgi:hypothetical protein